MASVSKTFCAFAAWKALLDSPAFSRESKMQTILKLKQRNGSPPADPDFADVRVRHLLESISGIDQWAFRGSMKKLRDSNDDPRPTQPASMETLLGMVAEMEMNQDPGETISYGKTDYILLGQVAAQLSKASSFDVALKALVLDPLKMTRTRSSRARVEDRAPDEAMHHLSDLSTNTSAVHNDRRLVASQYGEENYNLFDGAGGISTAMVDLARLCAMFSCRTNNPVLPPSVLKAMFEAAVASEATQGDHGHHGFDNPSGSDPTFTLDKGGSLPGVGSGFFGKTGKFFVTIARNGPVDPNSMGPTDWNTDLYKMAKDIDWAGKDMFPQFGMPTLKP